jgi:hypothetical protein
MGGDRAAFLQLQEQAGAEHRILYYRSQLLGVSEGAEEAVIPSRSFGEAALVQLVPSQPVSARACRHHIHRRL